MRRKLWRKKVSQLTHMDMDMDMDRNQNDKRPSDTSHRDQLSRTLENGRTDRASTLIFGDD